VQCGSGAHLQNIEHRLGADALYALHRTCPLSAPTFVEENNSFRRESVDFPRFPELGIHPMPGRLN
jgi:hypothetical protein